MSLLQEKHLENVPFTREKIDQEGLLQRALLDGPDLFVLDGLFLRPKPEERTHPPVSVTLLWSKKGGLQLACSLVFLVLLKVIFYFHPFLGAFWGLFFIFGGFLKQIQVLFDPENAWPLALWCFFCGTHIQRGGSRTNTRNWTKPGHLDIMSSTSPMLSL